MGDRVAGTNLSMIVAMVSKCSKKPRKNLINKASTLYSGSFLSTTAAKIIHLYDFALAPTIQQERDLYVCGVDSTQQERDLYVCGVDSTLGD